MSLHDENSSPGPATETAEAGTLALRFLKRVLVRSGEVVIAVVIALLFFLGFMGIISFSFPRARVCRT